MTEAGGQFRSSSLCVRLLRSLGSITVCFTIIHSFTEMVLLHCSKRPYIVAMKFPSDDDRQAPSGPAPTIFEAIVRQLCVTATYNRSRVTLAPHVIYTRHGDLFVDAVTLVRDGQPPRELKLGTFKLAGLGELALTQRRFDISALFEPEAEKYEDAALIKVEPEPIPA